MLMIGTSRLAEEMYLKWRQDRYDETSAWDDLSALERDRWRAVARRAADLLVEAMGAAPLGSDKNC